MVDLFSRNSTTTRSRLTLGIALVVVFAFGWGSSYVFHKLFPRAVTEQYVREGGLPLVNPLLLCDASAQAYAPYAPLKNDLSALVNSLKTQGTVNRMSVYVRELDLGRWTGVNESETFIPASLIKVPMLLAYLGEAESNPAILQDHLTYTGAIDANAGESFKPSKPLRAGGSYSVDELLASMIEQSDNNALALLSNHIATSTLLSIYDAAGSPPVEDGESETVSPQAFSRFFRLLYNTAYAGKAFSQVGLLYLSQSTFIAGIVAGVPSSITVAHKFGERTIENASGSVAKRELHDCGIVYYPRSPYLLCVMTEGSDFSHLESAIAQVSHLVYAQVDSGLFRE